MKTQHTPGPWSYYFEEPNRDWALVMAGGKSGQIVANVNTKSCPDHSSAPAFRVMPADANARLIAAAPDLLEALKTAVLKWDIRTDIYYRTNNIPRPKDIEPDWIVAARAAILKATQPN